MYGFMSYARKPQAFKPRDEWYPFEAKRTQIGVYFVSIVVPCEESNKRVRCSLFACC